MSKAIVQVQVDLEMGQRIYTSLVDAKETVDELRDSAMETFKKKDRAVYNMYCRECDELRDLIAYSRENSGVPR